MIIKSQLLKRRTKPKFYKNIGNYFDEKIKKILDLKKILLLKMFKVLVKLIMK